MAEISSEGFELVGVTPAVSSSGFPKLVQWIDSGYAAQMDYFANRLDAYKHPSGVMPGTRSIIALAYPYAASSDQAADPGNGRVARYAWSGIDYHDVIHAKLKKILKAFLEFDTDVQVRGIVDTAPLMEREVAAAAGMGWRGKNTLLLNRRWGSYFFLACILIDRDFIPTFASPARGHCGSCTACLDACPTDAFVGPGLLDARRCISYLTIEHDGSIEAHLRPGIGDWVFGCDICQEVCPWNRKRSRAEPRPSSAMHQIDLHELFSIDDAMFRQRYRQTPLWRTRRRGLLRNAAIVLGNQADTKSFLPLRTGLRDTDPIIRGASAWALSRIPHIDVAETLKLALLTEHDESVRAEIKSSLCSLAESD
jgi:epoxyqueuosine reductase